MIFNVKKTLIVGGLLTGLLVAAFTSGFAAASSKNNPIYKAIRAVFLWQRSADISENNHWRTRVDAFSRYKGRPDIVMLGDSLTEHGLWQELLPETSIINRGISGDGVDGVLLRIDQIIATQPRMVFIMLGLNDIRAYTDPDVVAAVYGKIIERLSPVKEVVVQSTLFTNDEADHNAGIKRLNDTLAKLCSSAPNCRFLDLNAFLSRDGVLLRDFTIDGRHLNGDGYRVWAREIGPLMSAPETGA
ncbi:MAG: hypothetical protein E5W94_02405 [Mesorhizobium sp.]|nr:MAG: hypothetical protein E5W94_02405 [Mesorhizobium sp.]